jgi:hypothetical protein
MRYKFLSMVLAGLLSTSFLSGDYVSIGDNVDSTKTDKGIKVEGIDDLKGNADYIEYAKALKESYRVNEPIKMKFRLKKDSYIYVVNIGSSGDGYLIFPNNYTADTEFKANEDIVIPREDAEYDFVSDREGIEEVYIIATNKQITPEDLKKVFDKKVAGIIPKASQNNMNTFSKDIAVVAKKGKLKYDIEKLKIKIKSDKPSGSETEVNVNVKVRN